MRRGRRRSIPFVAQTNEADCGVACLAMTLAWHGRPRRLEALRRAAEVSRRGASAAGLLAAAESSGLRARGMQVEALEDLGRLSRGSILHWRFRHFVVLDRVRRDGGADVLDPAAGRRRVSREELDRSFTGIAIALEPGAGEALGEDEPGAGEGGGAAVGRSRPSVRRYLAAAAASGRLGKLLAFAVLGRLLLLAVPGLLVLLVDGVALAGDGALLARLAVVATLLVALAFVVRLFRANLLLDLRTVAGERSAGELLERLLALPPEAFETRPAASLLVRLRGAAAVHDALARALVAGVADAVAALGALAILLAVNVGIALAVLALGAVRPALVLLARRRIREREADAAQAGTDLAGFEARLVETAGRGRGSEERDRDLARWAGLRRRVAVAARGRGRVEALLEAAGLALALGVPLAALLLGAREAMAGELGIGAVSAVALLAAGFGEASASLARRALELDGLSGPLDRLDDLLAGVDAGGGDGETAGPPPPAETVSSSVAD